ncbi:MAG TPA: hypothetical protein VLA17_12530 [Candidatus Limnocylindria bacterium]|nr:hypothetical protein [Candidatus Limnocylindria bacterium]
MATRALIFLAAAIMGAPAPIPAAQTLQSEKLPAVSLGELLKVNVPVVLCIDDKPTGGGQPSSQAYAQAAANGYRSIVTLRSRKDGVDLWRERAMVERQKMRYFNIPVVPHAPTSAQADEFLALTRDTSNHPMLINCAFAERVAPLMMIFRMVEQGWGKEKAIKEATGMGLKKDRLEQFADAYLARRTSKSK